MLALVHRTGVAVLALLVSCQAAMAGVLVVDTTGGGDFTQISAAVAAAVDGDTILVRGGAYEGFVINGKSLVVIADAGVTPFIGEPVGIQNIPANEKVVVSGLYVEATTEGPALSITACQGPVRLQDCNFTGSANLSCEPTPSPGDGRPGALVIQCADVAFTQCMLGGGNGHGTSWAGDCYVGGRGGDGLRGHSAVVALYDCQLTGAQGGYGATESVGGDGGDGARVQGGRVVASGCSFTGGAGGLGNDWVTVTGHGNGGDGLWVQDGSTGHLLANAYDGGEPGTSTLGLLGLPGLPLNVDGPTTLYTGSAHTFDASPKVVREGETLTLSFTGAPGDVAMLVAGIGPAQLLLPNLAGVLLINPGFLIGPIVLFPVPGSGTLNVPLAVPSLSPAVLALPAYLQGVVSESAGLRLGSGVSIVLLDASL